MLDACGRNIDYVRISITDRCNLRCLYCMPETGVTAIEHGEILRYEEIIRLARLFPELGIHHIRITGGEPTVRKGWMELIGSLHAIEGIESIAMTTNAQMLYGCVDEAYGAGLRMLNISMDALDPEIYKTMTRGGNVKKVLSVIDDALALGMNVKINAVPVRGMNDQELCDLAALARDRDLCVRFIELMPLGCGANLEPVPSDEVQSMIENAFGPCGRDDDRHGWGAAKYIRPKGFKGSIGFISPISHEFCSNCNRIRVTSDGYLKLCLNHTAGVDLRAMLRNGANDEELLKAIRMAILRKPERHGFESPAKDREIRRMNEIGG